MAINTSTIILPAGLGVKLNKAGEVVPHKLTAVCADDWYLVRAERLALEKQVKELQAVETFLKNHLIDNIPMSQATGVAGRVARVSIESKEKPTVDTENGGWDKLYGYILSNAKKNPGVWSLLQKRLGETAAKEMLAAKAKLPGVVLYQYKDISYSSLR